jgi:uncharacterized protein (DUF362 family)/NAD-dependent dihydropyrimidine dehydrogenase PreA subunit
VLRGLDLLGGPGRFFSSGDNVLLKPNLLFGKPPERCVNTHPAFLHALTRICRDAGAEVRYGDHPGILAPASAAKRAGWADAAKELGVEMAEFRVGRRVAVEDPLIQDEFDIADGVFEADSIISLPKLKTHTLTKYTGALKNQYGCIYNYQKKSLHMKYADARDFSKMIADLNTVVRPKLFIMDAVCAMEGHGPQSGDPVAMNAVLISADPVALDATACRLIDLNPEYIHTTTYGSERGLGAYREEEIEVLGDDLPDLINSDFTIDRNQIRPFRRGSAVSVLTNIRVPKPAIDPEKCIKCGICVEACPAHPKALSWGEEGKEAPPEYDYSICIRCYCCQEMCPESAVYLKKAVLGRVR